MSEGDRSIVVGGGVAGLAAARDLGDRGVPSLLLEGGTRLGGRMWRRAFSGTDRMIELGGRWVAPHAQPFVRQELDRYAIELCRGESDDGRGFHARVDGLPVPHEEILDLERAAVFIRNAVARIDPTLPLDIQPIDDLDVSWADFLRPLSLGEATRSYLDSCASAHTGRAPTDAAALYFLEELAAGGMTTAIISNAADMPGMHMLQGGSTSLIEALAGDVAGEIRYESVVTGIAQTAAGVEVELSDGTVHAGGAVILAVPINCWSAIEFDPPLSTGKQQAHESRPATVDRQAFYAAVHGGPSLREKAPCISRAGAGTVEVRYIADLEEGQLISAAGRALGDIDLLDQDHVRALLRDVLPGAELQRLDGHSWARDPLARGDWASYVPGVLTKAHSELSRPERRLGFAGGDIAPRGFIGWIDGAIESGRRAAAWAAGVTGGAPTYRGST
jgi:monoamine oxidase